MELDHFLLKGHTDENNVFSIFQKAGGDDTHRFTYGDARICLETHSRWLLQRLQSHAVKDSRSTSSQTPSTVVAYISENSLDLILSVVSCTSSSVSALPALINTRWSAQEMSRALESACLCDTTILLYSAKFKKIAHETSDLIGHSSYCIPLPQLTSTIASMDSIGSNQTETLSGKASQLSPSEFSDRDAVVLFTSGTTSGAKGVLLSHRALIVQALAKLDAPCEYSSKTALLAATLPFFHVGGLSSFLAVWIANGALVLPRSLEKEGFDQESVWRAIAIGTVNALAVVPAMIYMLQKGLSEPTTYPHVDLILIGGQTASMDSLKFLRRTFPAARIVQTYACTEAASSITFNQIDDIDAIESDCRSPDCIGKPPSHVKVKVVWNDSNCAVVGSDRKVGLIATKGPHVMNGK